MWVIRSYSNVHRDLEKAFYGSTSHLWALHFSLIRHKKILCVQIDPRLLELWISSSLLFKKNIGWWMKNSTWPFSSVLDVGHGNSWVACQVSVQRRSEHSLLQVGKDWTCLTPPRKLLTLLVLLDTTFLVGGIWKVQTQWTKTTLFQISAAACRSGYFNYIFQGTAERFVFYIDVL